MADAVKTNVACKLPNGLVVEHMGDTVTLNGANSDSAQFGFGITRGVDADWFKAWLGTDGKTLPFVANGSVFAFDGSDVAGAARERQKDPRVATGQEPLNPDKPAEGIEPTDEQKVENAKAEAAANDGNAGRGRPR